jgi:hypothetical protein
MLVVRLLLAVVGVVMMRLLSFFSGPWWVVLMGLVARSDSHGAFGERGMASERLVDFWALSKMKKQSMPWFCGLN